MKLERLKEWREARGLTQKELSREAHVAEKTVARIELGDSVRPNTARKIADALGVSVADLLERPPVPLAEAGSMAEPHLTWRSTWEQFKNLTPEEQEEFFQNVEKGRATFGREVLQDLAKGAISVDQAAERLHITR